MNVKYPDIKIRLSGKDGNAFTIIGRVRRAMKKSDVPTEEIETFCNEAMSGDYEHLLRTAMKWVDVH